MTPSAPPLPQQPARLLPLLYFLVGYLSLPLAFAVAAYSPRSLSGFYYHSRLIGVVHLVTLGWITATILGMLYLAVPLLLQRALPVRQGDYWAFGSYVIGVIGMVSHFWIHEFGGMAWSGLMVAAAILHVGGRVVPLIVRATIPAGLKIPFVLAFSNMALAATAGVVLGFDKVHHFLPGYVVWNVLAHAHVAALGWASLMVLGLSYLALPVVALRRLDGRSIGRSAALLEVATLGLAATIIAGSRWGTLLGIVAGIAFVPFLRDVWVMQRQRPTATILSPDVGGWHVVHAAAYLIVAVALGIALAWMPPSTLTLRLALLYGVCGLLGFLTQWLMGLGMRMVPLAFRANTTRPWAIPAFVMWSAGVLLLGYGFFVDSALIVAIGGAAGCVATLATALQGALVIAPAVELGPWISWRRDRFRRGGASQPFSLSARRR